MFISPNKEEMLFIYAQGPSQLEMTSYCTISRRRNFPSVTRIALRRWNMQEPRVDYELKCSEFNANIQMNKQTTV